MMQSDCMKTMKSQLQNAIAVLDNDGDEHGVVGTLREAAAEMERMDQELDIVHEAITELYNLDPAAPIIKAALARIAAIKASGAKNAPAR